MKVGIIGANGHVGTELCFIMNKMVEVVPIVRNKMGSIFLNHNGFNCRLAEINEKRDAQETLKDLDVIVISSFAADRLTGSQNQTSKIINENLIKNSFEYSKKDAVIIYLSTIRAFAHQVDPKTSRFIVPRYDREKQHLEKVLMSESKRTAKRGYAFRLGMVFGENQVFTGQIKEKLTNNTKLYVNVSPHFKSNIVHTVTIADAILICANNDVKPDIYSVVNHPQWTWKDVYDYYNKETTIEFIEQTQPPTNIVDSFWKLLKSNKRLLIPILYHLPSKYESNILRIMSVKKFQSEISELKEDKVIDNGNGSFDYKPIPGPFIPELQETRDLLKNYHYDVFSMQK